MERLRQHQQEQDSQVRIQQLWQPQEHRCLRVELAELPARPRCLRQARDLRFHQAVQPLRLVPIPCLQQERDSRLHQAVQQVQRPVPIRCLRPVQDSRLHPAVQVLLPPQVRHRVLESAHQVAVSREQPVEVQRRKLHSRPLALQSSRRSLS